MGIGGFGMGEMILLFLVVLLLFGAKRLPEIGSALGKGIREFKSSVREIESELKVPDEPQHRTVTPPNEVEQTPRRLTTSAGPETAAAPQQTPRQEAAPAQPSEPAPAETRAEPSGEGPQQT
ncbi:MAG: twin-arginine translocase TatA/TatE family subunit [Gemmatimonadota bacterium]